MDILHYIGFSFKGIKNSYPVQMSAMKLQCHLVVLQCHLVVLHCTTYCISIASLLIWCQGYLKNLQKIIKILQNHIHCIYTRNSWKAIIIIIISCL